MPPWYGENVETGDTPLRRRAERRLRRTVDRGNRGNMLRAAAFVDPDGPRRSGIEAGQSSRTMIRLMATSSPERVSG